MKPSITVQPPGDGDERNRPDGTRAHRRRDRLRIRDTILIIATIIASYAAWQGYTTSHDLQVALRHQTENRALNVASWCEAIDTLDRTLVGYVQIFVTADPRIPPLKLTQLNCPALERKTLASTGAHIKPAAKKPPPKP